MIRIKIEGKNISDIWSLACVRAIKKAPDGSMDVGVRHKNYIGKPYIVYGLIGDTIEVESEQSEEGKIIDQEQ